MAKLEAPKNSTVAAMNAAIDFLIKGLGADAAIAAATAYQPWLGWPVIRNLFEALVKWLAGILDENIKRNADIIVIRFQNDVRKLEYDKAIEEFKAAEEDPEALRRAKEAIDRLVSRARP